MADLEATKSRLVDALKDKTPLYWELMKNWYRRKISKEDFEGKAKSLLGEDNVNLHNEFLFAILVKCQTGLATDAQQPTLDTRQPHTPLTKPKPKRQHLSPSPADSIPYSALDPLRYHLPPKVQLASRDLDSILLCSHELLLPDLPTLHTRMLLGAWEAGLEGVAEDAARLLMLALENHMKNVLQALISHSTSWQLRGGHFQHSFGRGLDGTTLSRPTTLPDLPYLRDTAEAQEAMIFARGRPEACSEPINLFHVRDALMVNRSCIPVHPVFSCCVERVLASMWHPGRDEELQQRTVEQWQRNEAQGDRVTSEGGHVTPVIAVRR